MAGKTKTKHKQNRMKNNKTLVVGVAVLGLAICGFAIAGSHHGARNHGASHRPKDAAFAVQHLTEAFARFAPLDVNKDGQLDAVERKSLAKAIAEGTVQLPAHIQPNGVTVGVEMINHIADMYARFAAYDANHDGAFDVAEQAALKSAIETGELTCPQE